MDYDFQNDSLKEQNLDAKQDDIKEKTKNIEENRTLLPKKSNDYHVSDEYKFKGIVESMTWKERRNVMEKNNFEYTRGQYEQMGIKVIGEYDDLFCSVELPAGWECKGTDHPMWNEVMDEKGRKRISFFYKRAWYDREAFSDYVHRYSFSIMPFDDFNTDATYQERKFKPWKLYITDNGKAVKKLCEKIANSNQEYLKINDELKKIAKEYLDKNYPEWENIHAYWS